MKITSLETIRVGEHPNVIWVEIATDAGLVGLGETFFMPKAVEAYLHEWVAPRLLGKDPAPIETLVRGLRPYLGGRSAGVETRGNSAVDIALWDLRGKALNQPLSKLLGATDRESIRIYNTCAGPEYMRRTQGQRRENWGLSAGGKYDDLNGFLHRPAELASELLSEGITAMKIWPFDLAAEANDGLSISAAELQAALRPFEAIRASVGSAIDIMVEFHSHWLLSPALKIARALRQFDTLWHEDPIRMESLGDLRRYAQVSWAPVCASETLAAVSGFRDLLETGAAGIVMLDLAWCGGLTEARKIAAMAEAWRLPVAPHDCTGPVVLCASTHLCMAVHNALVQETVRAYHRGWYQEAVDHVPPIQRGMISPPPGPGLGLSLHADLSKRFTVTRVRSDLEGLAR